MKRTNTPTIIEVDKAFKEYERIYYARYSTQEELEKAYLHWKTLERACPQWEKIFFGEQYEKD